MVYETRPALVFELGLLQCLFTNLHKKTMVEPNGTIVHTYADSMLYLFRGDPDPLACLEIVLNWRQEISGNICIFVLIIYVQLFI